MKSGSISLIFAIATALAALPATANEKLAEKHACLACHAVNKKVVGPSFKDIAAKYRGQKGIESKLAAKVKAGGVGVWGQVPMAPNTHVPDADIAALVKWILATK